mgnify:CR=1 FL=1
MDILIFSKDRAFQLHTSLETIERYVTGVDNIYVQFGYSNKQYLEGYQKLNNIFNNVIFVDESVYGFQQTLTAILSNEIQSDNVMLEVDDTIYFKSLNLDQCDKSLKTLNSAGKYCFGLDPTLFNKQWWDKQEEAYYTINKSTKGSSSIEELALKYPFNASSVIHRKKDVLELIQTDNKINTPVELEIAGSKSPIFQDYTYNLFHHTEVVKQIHTNNSLNRYEEVYSVEYLNSLLLSGEVIDTNKINVESFTTDLRWFNGESIGRFPIFPWEIPPIHHKELIECRVSLIDNDNWWGNTLNNITNIPLSINPPEWQSSTPTPADQLFDLGSRGPFVNSFRDYKLDEKLNELVKGKRVAYVCPSPHLKGKGLGKLIDSYDVVVRINQAYDMPESDWEDFGQRTDIVMNCLNHYKQNAMSNNVEFVKSLKYVVCPMVLMWNIQSIYDFMQDLKVDWHDVSDGYLFKCFNEIGTTANTGLMGVITLLNYDVKELFITGMTFFNMNTFGKVYNDTYHDAASAIGNFSSTENKEPSIEQLRMDIHHQQPQIDYFRKMVDEHYGTLTLDDYLMNEFINNK